MKRPRILLGLTYADVLIKPRRSSISSRSSEYISTTSMVTSTIALPVPIISANMDTVTESTMAIAMARVGGLGIIHRFLSIEQQAREVQRVKRAENVVIENPIIIGGDATLGSARKLMQQHGITSLIVCRKYLTEEDETNIVEGILTSRDIRFKTDDTVKVCEIMTPKERLITAPKTITRTEAMQLMDKSKIEKLPLVYEGGELAGLITAADFLKHTIYQHAARDKEGRLLVGAAIGVKDALPRAKMLVAVGCDILVIDIAHGHHDACIDLIKLLRKEFPDVSVIAGNVATKEGARDLAEAGAQGIKVGIGPGEACATRNVAGVGVPQFTAVQECAKEAQSYGIPIIADGGIREPGDVAKAIAGGASTVMIGNLFAGTDESPGKCHLEGQKMYKVFRGMASYDASMSREQHCGEETERTERTPEGISKRVLYKGSVSMMMKMLLDGLLSGMSYRGARTIQEFQEGCEFIRNTEAGRIESTADGYER